MPKAQVAKIGGEVLRHGFGGPKADVYNQSLVVFKQAMAERDALPVGMPMPRGLLTRLESPAYKILVVSDDHSKTA